MQTTQRTFVFNALLFVVALLALGAAYAQTGAASPEAPAALPNGINFSGAYTPDDVAYFQDDLERLHRDLPEWWQYVLDARPFTIVIDPRTARGAIVAVTGVCVGCATNPNFDATPVDTLKVELLAPVTDVPGADALSV